MGATGMKLVSGEKLWTRQSSSSAVPHTSGEQRQGNGIAIATKKLAGSTFARAAEPAPDLNRGPENRRIIVLLAKRVSRKVESPRRWAQRRMLENLFPTIAEVGEEVRQMVGDLRLFSRCIQTDELL